MEDKLLVIDGDERSLHVYNLHGGKLIISHRLESWPLGVCLINKTEVAVCLGSEVVILSLKSRDGVKRVNTLQTGLDCNSLVKWRSDKLVISGRNDDAMLCWGILSITDGRLDSTDVICTGYGGTHMAVRENAVYISCQTYDSITRGVYAFNLLTNKQKFLYQHRKLLEPRSIMADRDYVYVCDSNIIHQLTDSGQLVTIHTVSSWPRSIFYDDQHGLLYTTSRDSNVITVYKMEYSHQPGVPVEILKMDDRSIQLFKEALKDGKETVHSIRIMVVGHMGVGKTTLVKRLLGEEVNISERHSTEGIDVYIYCCDVSLSTHEWTRRTKDSEQDYKLQRLVKVLNENYQTGEREVDSELATRSNPRETTDNNYLSHVADDDNDREVIYRRSQLQNTGQNLSSNLQKEISFVPSETNTIPGSELGENVATEHYKMDPLRDMLKLLQQNPNKAKQDISKHAYLTILDFAGQYAFYTTHQMFLTRRAIYLLVSDASKEVSDLVEDDCYLDFQGNVKCRVHDLVQVWMNSIHTCAPPDKKNLNSANSQTSSFKVIPPPVILVGTHIDQIPQNLPGMVGNSRGQIVMPGLSDSSNPGPRSPMQDDVQVKRDFRRERGQKYLNEIRSFLRDKPTTVHLIDEDFAIDNTVLDRKLEELKKKIVEVASQQPYWGEQIPTRWFLLEQELMRLRDAGVKVISWSMVEELNKNGTIQIKESEELDLFLKYLHETGTIIYFSIEVLRENIVLDPKWLIDALKLLINAQPNLPNSPAENGSQSVGQIHITSDKVVTQKYFDFKEKGILTLEIVDAVWTQDKYPELHANRDHILRIMEQLNIIAKPRVFTETGEKLENYFLAPCMLHQKTPGVVISPEQDPHIVSTLELCCVFTEKFLPPPIFHRLLAACIAQWPVAQNRKTKQNLIFCGSCVFDIDLFHRLTLYYSNHVVFARITRMVVDEVKTPDAKLCSRVRRFITKNLSKIISYLGQNLQYALRIQSPPSQDAPEARMFRIWFEDEGYDSDAPIMPEHMNQARLYVALVTVCTNALQEILLTHVPKPHANIYQAIRAKKADLTKKTKIKCGQRQNALLLPDQCQVVFPDPRGRYVASVDQFDISVLYILIRHVSTVSASKMDWGNEPIEKPSRDRCLGASLERIRLYRNKISHSMDGKITQQNFDDYWNKIDAVLDDIELELGNQGFRAQLEKQRRQVISIYEAC